MSICWTLAINNLSTRRQGKSLAALTVAVLDVDVVHLEVASPNSQSGRLIIVIAVRLAGARGDCDLQSDG